MGDKSVPELTIKLEPMTLMGLGVGLLGLGAGWVLWGLQSLAVPPGSMVSWGSRLSPDSAQSPASRANSGSDSAAFDRGADIPRPEDLSRSLQAPLPPESVWVEPVRVKVEAGVSGSVETASDVPLSTPAPTIAAAGAADQTTEPAPIAHAGMLRVGNKTEHPVRLALLQRSVQALPPSGSPLDLTPANAPDAAHSASLPPTEPFHWDFAPGEGWVQGLILSLPQGDLSLVPGDVLVAFAQDGSHRYWGPFVVGETELPYWHPEQQEWQLLLQSNFP